MLLLTSFFLLTLLQCSNAQNKTSITPADCNSVETDAGVALDLVNRHRRDGYVFGLFRVADAHEQHIGNSSVLYLTLDVLETECSVLSRRHWESCEYSETYSMDFGQCKIITYTSQLRRKPQLYGFNCTLSPVPPDLLECKDCPVKVEVLEVTEQHKNIAAKALKKFNSESNHTNYFDVNKIEKILKTTASREGYILGFSIKETNCSKSTQQADQTLECDFLDDWHAHVGFCKARITSDPDEPDGTDVICDIYHPWHHYGQRRRHSTLREPHRHPHHHFDHRHRHRHYHRHGCPPSSQSRPEDPEHNHSFDEEHQDSDEGPAPPPPPHVEQHHHLHPPHHCPPPHGGPHHHSPPPPDGSHPPPQEEPQHPLSAPPPHDEPHHPPLGPHHEPHCPPHGPHHPHPHHHRRPHCPPPPHGPHHPHPHHHCRPHCPHPPHGPHHHLHPPHRCPPPHDEPHHHSPPPPDGSHPPPQEESQHPLSAPPPHDEPHHPPLGPHHEPHCPPHGPHHPHPHHHRRPHCPPPPHGPRHHHPPPHHGPHHPPPPDHPPHLCHHYYRLHGNKTSVSGKYFPFHLIGAVHHIPILNQQDSLTPPTANFPELFQSSPHSSSTGEGISFTGSSLKETPEDPGFTDHPTQSKSCPGKPKLVLPKILPLFPHSSVSQNSPT